MNRAALESTRKITTDPALLEKRKRRPCLGCSCLSFLVLIAIFLYFLFPGSTRFLLLGIDRSPDGTMAGRSDTIMLVSVDPLRPTVKLLSIPRDLWVPIPGFGENRINAAHFFAEAQEPDTGPALALETVNANFNLNLSHYARFNLEGLPAVVDALGGIPIDLPEPMAGLPAGASQLDGATALAFLRSRSDGDDFFRIQQGQLFVSAFIRRLLNPATWPKIPAAIAALPTAFDTDIPIWLLPRLGLALLRASISGMDSYAISRDMTTPTVTDGGAQVLIPRWDLIHPYIAENF